MLSLGDNLQFYPILNIREDEAGQLFFLREQNMTNVQHAFEPTKIVRL